MKKSFRIYWHPRLEKWMVNIRWNKQNYHIGYFKEFTDAVIARNKAFHQLYGQGGLASAFIAEKRGSRIVRKGEPPKKKQTKFERLLNTDSLTAEDRRLIEVTEQLKKKNKRIDEII